MNGESKNNEINNRVLIDELSSILNTQILRSNRGLIHYRKIM